MALMILLGRRDTRRRVVLHFLDWRRPWGTTAGGNELLKMESSWMWNVETIRELEVLIKTHIPKFFSMSNSSKKQPDGEVNRRFGMGGFVGYDSDGMSGGLALFWHKGMQVDVKEV
jgi:hypothetical protein